MEATEYKYIVTHFKDTCEGIILKEEYFNKENNKYHRENGPAEIYTFEDGKQTQRWYKNGKLHNDNGPAEIMKNGIVTYYLDGSSLTKKEFEARKSPHEGETIIVDGKEYILTLKK